MQQRLAVILPLTLAWLVAVAPAPARADERTAPAASAPTYPRTVVRDGQRCLQFLDTTGEVRERCTGERATKRLTHPAQREPEGPAYGRRGATELAVATGLRLGRARQETRQLEVLGTELTGSWGWWVRDGLLVPVTFGLGLSAERYSWLDRVDLNPEGTMSREARLGVSPLWLFGAPVPAPWGYGRGIRPFVQGHALVGLSPGPGLEVGLSLGLRVPVTRRHGVELKGTVLSSVSSRFEPGFGAVRQLGVGLAVFLREPGRSWTEGVGEAPSGGAREGSP